MRTAVTLVRRHGAPTFELYAGPEVPVPAQKSTLKTLLGSREHPHFAEVLYFDQRTRRKVFRTNPGAIIPASFADQEPVNPPAPPVDPAPPRPSRRRAQRNPAAD